MSVRRTWITRRHVVHDAVAPGLNAQLLPPSFLKAGGSVPVGFAFALINSNTNGAILFTTDGFGSAKPVGSVRTNAMTYKFAVTVNHSMTVNARVLNGTNWNDLRQQHDRDRAADR